MKTSDITNELDAALSLFQGEMPTIKKDVNVKMNGVSKSGKEFKVDYDYAPLESIQEIANPLLSKHGLNITQDIGSTYENGHVVNFISTRVGHKSGQWKISQWFLDMSGVTKEQDRGSKITFNKRYAFVAALNIALSDEDNDATDVKANEKKQTDHRPDLLDGTFHTGCNEQLKGKKYSEVKREVLVNFITHWENQVAKNGQPLNGQLASQFESVKKYLQKS